MNDESRPARRPRHHSTFAPTSVARGDDDLARWRRAGEEAFEGRQPPRCIPCGGALSRRCLLCRGVQYDAHTVDDVARWARQVDRAVAQRAA